MKWCAKCQTHKDPTEFHNSRSAPDGKYGRCKVCHLAAQKELRTKWTPEQRAKDAARRLAWQRANPDRLKASVRKYSYGVTDEKVNRMMEEQNSLCAIQGCGRPAHSIDHDHSCCPQKKRACGNCVRGILCRECNVMLGLALDDPERLRSAASYLLKDIHTA